MARDLYQEVADEEGVDRETVKQLCFCFLYSMNCPTDIEALKQKIKSMIQTFKMTGPKIKSP